MPLYEYECAACGKRFELIQKFSDPPETACVACGGAAQRLLSASAVHFKGSGWYATDYARKPAPAESSAEKAESKAEGKTEPAAKKEESKPAAPAAKDST
ncbi:MAG: FmdB family zinc ribbon protein [Candidatus Acidiferrales bacterium]